ncbi:SDR family NAD(P)-dependent oxidoreductase [Microbacterium sp. Root180]|uniref:SDR family NAD(P)-dependent oxidoreductase n=1 Tax=Microbacterium sp. Root180 TaxID=1736483 RepID=UPI0006FF9385|nr:SDR family oxidoreductase [Microbacterium sp. Root180]KRB38925.1 oxidoreductase [Microbacterium sp. Root180]
MRIDLSGRTALVTGSTAGIGRAIADGLAAAGASVIVNGRDPARVAAVAAELGAEGIAADVSTAEGANEIFDHVPFVDILVNNTGTFTAQPVFEIDDDGWRRMLEVNVISGVRLTRHYAPLMAERGHGRVLFIASEAGVQPPTNMVHYGVSKTAQSAAARGFAQALAGTGVTVNSVLAGPTMSDGVLAMWDDLYPGLTREDQEARFIAEGRAAGSLLGRVIRPHEIANLVTYLASDYSSATTGRAVGVDGGLIPTVFP